MRRFLIWIFVLGLPNFSSVVLAEEEEARNPEEYHLWADIIAQDEEPTPMTFIQADAAIPFGEFLNWYEDQFDEDKSARWLNFKFKEIRDYTKELKLHIQKNLPYYIALLEKNFPDAIWAPMGRDGAPFARLMGFFYAMAGEPERAVRIPASNQTMHNVTIGELIDILVSHGLSRDQKFILFDRSSMHATSKKISQTTMFMRAGYAFLLDQGMWRRDILDHFGIIGLGTSPSNTPQVYLEEWDDLKTTIRRDYAEVNETFVTSLHQLDYVGTPHTLAVLPFKSNRRGIFSDGLNWHKGYGIVVQRQFGDGVVRFGGMINPGGDLFHRLWVLTSMAYIYRAIGTPEFFESVNLELAQLNLEKSFEFREDLLPRTSFDVRVNLKRLYELSLTMIKTEFKKFLDKYTQYNPDRDYKKSRWRAVRNEIEHGVTSFQELRMQNDKMYRNNFLLFCLEETVLAYGEARLTHLSLMRLVQTFVSLLVPDDDIIQELTLMVKHYPALKEMLVDSSALKFELGTGGQAIRNYFWIKRNVLKPMGCEEALVDDGFTRGKWRFQPWAG